MKQFILFTFALLFLSSLCFSQLNLDVEGTARITDGIPRLQLYDNGSGENRVEGQIHENSDNIYVGALKGNLYLGADTSGSTFQTDITILGYNGNVGIGENSPEAPMHVKTTGSEIARFESSAASKWLSFYNGGTRKGILWNSGNDMVLRADEAGGRVRLQTVGMDRMTILDDGMVGFNTTTPTADITLNQSATGFTGPGGMEFKAGTDGWKIYFSAAHFSFQDRTDGDNDRRAYVEDNTGNYVQPSDLAKKENVVYMQPVLEKVTQLKPCSYNYKSVSEPVRTSGFIAQEVMQVMPELIRYDEEGGVGLAYSEFAVIAIKAIQEQQEMINQLKAEVEALKNK